LSMNCGSIDTQNLQNAMELHLGKSLNDLIPHSYAIESLSNPMDCLYWVSLYWIRFSRMSDIFEAMRQLGTIYFWRLSYKKANYYVFVFLLIDLFIVLKKKKKLSR
jgi:hypothetical protein